MTEDWEEIIAIGDDLKIKVLDGKYAGTYTSRVLDMGPERLIISPLGKGSRTLVVESGTGLSVALVKKNAQYQFKSEVVAPFGGVPRGLVISAPGGLARRQRRGHVRLEVSVPVRYYVRHGAAHRRSSGKPLEGHGEGKAGSVRHLTLIPSSYECRVRDLSGGGILLATREPFEDGTMLDLELEITEDEPLRVTGEVVRCEETSDEGCFGHLVGVKFVGIQERDRDRIVRFVFARQRWLRQRGLL